MRDYGKVAVIFGPFDPLGNEGSLGDPSGNEGSPPLRERRDPSPGGTLGYQNMAKYVVRKTVDPAGRGGEIVPM